MITEKIEVLELIANRTPPGDKWELVIDRDNVVEGLVETLTTFVRKTKYKGDFRLSPLNGKLFIIKEEVVSKPEPTPEKWDLYGES